MPNRHPHVANYPIGAVPSQQFSQTLPTVSLCVRFQKMILTSVTTQFKLWPYPVAATLLLCLANRLRSPPQVPLEIQGPLIKVTRCKFTSLGKTGITKCVSLFHGKYVTSNKTNSSRRFKQTTVCTSSASGKERTTVVFYFVTRNIHTRAH